MRAGDERKAADATDKLMDYVEQFTSRIGFDDLSDCLR
jgi:hypothetical protein